VRRLQRFKALTNLRLPVAVEHKKTGAPPGGEAPAHAPGNGGTPDTNLSKTVLRGLLDILEEAVDFLTEAVGLLGQGLGGIQHLD
jgi:hypothetical protein